MPTRARAHTSRRRTPARDSGVKEPRRGPLPGVSNRPADAFRRRRSGRPARESGALGTRRWWWGGRRWWWGGAGLRRSRVFCRRRQGERAEIRRPGRSAAALALRLRPSLTPESARGAPVWPARSSGRPGAPSQGQGFAAHPVAVALHGLGMEAGPFFQVRPGAASAPPAEPAFGAGAVQPAAGADGTTVRASQPLNLARREQGEDGRRGDDDAVAVESVAITVDEDRVQRRGGRPGAVVAWLVLDTHATAGWRPEPIRPRPAGSSRTVHAVWRVADSCAAWSRSVRPVGAGTLGRSPGGRLPNRP